MDPPISRRIVGYPADQEPEISQLVKSLFQKDRSDVVAKGGARYRFAPIAVVALPTRNVLAILRACLQNCLIPSRSSSTQDFLFHGHWPSASSLFAPRHRIRILAELTKGLLNGPLGGLIPTLAAWFLTSKNTGADSRDFAFAPISRNIYR